MKKTDNGTLILDGKSLAKKIQEHIKEEITKSSKIIKLATVLIGDDKPSQLYVNNSTISAFRLGIHFKRFSLNHKFLHPYRFTKTIIIIKCIMANIMRMSNRNSYTIT